MMKITILNLLFFLILNMTPVAMAEDEVSEKELKTFLQGLKEKKDEELLITSPQFEECKTSLDNFRKDSEGGDNNGKYKEQLRKCVSEKIIGAQGAEGSDEKLLEIAQQLGLDSFNKTASESADSVREYLQDRLHKAIYGKSNKEKELQKLKDQKHVNHDAFYQLYAEQIGKNTLLEISRYCLESFGFKDDPAKFMYFVTSEGQAKGRYRLIKAYEDSDEGKTAAENLLNNDQNAKKIYQNSTDMLKLVDFETRYSLDENNLLQTVGQTALQDTKLPKTFWKDEKDNLVEFRVCTAKNEHECEKEFGKGKDKIPNRSVRENSLLKDTEFLLSRDDPEKNLIKIRYGFCASSIIKNMCELYNCRNVYDVVTDDKKKAYCKETFDIDVDSKRKEQKFTADVANNSQEQIKDVGFVSGKSDKKDAGFMACNLKQRLEEYRIVLKGTKDLQRFELANFKVKSGIRVGESFKGLFRGGSEVDELTSIGSQELVGNVDSLKNAQARAEELKEKCLDEKTPGNPLDGYNFKEGAKDDEECAPLLTQMNSAKFETLQIDTEAKTALRLKELEELDNSKESLEEYLEKHNLSQYIGRLEELDPEKLKKVIADDFRSQRMALIDNLKARFEKERGIKTGENLSQQDQDLNKQIEVDVATKNLSDIEKHKERVETLFEYSNIVSSYLEVKDEEGNTVGSNSTGRTQEVEGNEKLSEYFSDEGASSNSASGSLDYIQALDQILDFPEKDDTQANAGTGP